MKRKQIVHQWRRYLYLGVAGFVPVALAGCRSDEHAALAADARVILQAHLSHGLGDSPFDSPLVHDSVAALLIVLSRDCATTELLQDTHTDTTQLNVLLARLRSSGILEDRGGRTCTTFPVLLGDARDRYGALADGLAEQAYREFSDEWVTLLQVIRDRGWRDWQYHFVWSQLFDSQVAWAEMMTRGLVPPLSHVIAWVVYPEHSFRSGTNYYPDTELRDNWLMVTWRGGAANTTEPVAAHWDLLYRAGSSDRSLTAEEQNRLRSLGVMDSAGYSEFPVLRRHDPLHELLQSVARRYIDFVERRMPLAELVALSGVDERHAFAMTYHDVSWGIIERLVSSGQMDVPPALRRNGTGAPSHLRGAFGLTPAYPPFVDLIRSAIGAQ